MGWEYIEVLSTLDNYDCKENWSCRASFLDFPFFKDRYSNLFFYEYAKLTLIYIMEIFIIFILCVDMLDYVHGYYISMNLWVSMIFICIGFLLFMPMYTFYIILVLCGRFTLLVDIVKKIPLRAQIWETYKYITIHG